MRNTAHEYVDRAEYLLRREGCDFGDVEKCISGAESVADKIDKLSSEVRLDYEASLIATDQQLAKHAQASGHSALRNRIENVRAQIKTAQS